jgi:hypothetical protein
MNGTIALAGCAPATAQPQITNLIWSNEPREGVTSTGKKGRGSEPVSMLS